MLAELRPPTVQAALQSRELDPEHLCSLFSVELLDVAEHHGFTQRLGQGEDRGMKRLSDFPGVRAQVGRLRFGRDARCRVQPVHLCRLAGGAAARLEAIATGDLVQPGRQSRLAPEPGHAAEGGEHRLQDFARLLFVAAHAQPEAEELLLMLREELVHGIAFTAACRLDEFAFRALHRNAF